MDVWTAKCAQLVDHLSIHKYGLSAESLMNEAANKVYHSFADQFKKHQFKQVTILAGCGNNGGDALRVAYLIKKNHTDLPLTTFLVKNNDQSVPSELCQKKLDECQSLNISLETYTPGCLETQQPGQTCFIDGLLGIGFEGKLRPGALMNCIREVRHIHPRYTIAIDVPSGLRADDFDAIDDLVIPADLTVTFGAYKYCHLVSPARHLCGLVLVKPIGFAQQAIKEALEQHPSFLTPFCESCFVDPWPLQLHSDIHKFDRGHICVLGGSTGKHGAPILSALAALRCGAGWASVGLFESNHLRHALPYIVTFEETLCDGSEISEEKLFEFLESRHVKGLLIGPGLIRNCLKTSLLLRLAQWQESHHGFIVFDAGALKNLWPLLNNVHFNPNRTVALPHPGEWRQLGSAIFTDPLTQLDQLNDHSAMKNEVRQKGVSLVYKSATPIIITPHENILFYTGPSSLAKAGTGDVLAGVITAFGALGLDTGQACTSALTLVSQAAKSLGQQRRPDSIVATDLIDAL